MSAGEWVIAVLLVVAFIFIWAIAGAIIGAFVGWVVGWTPLGTWILETFAAAGMKGLSMVHIGTTIGFIMGFIPHHSKDD